jgi:glucosamine--fructose-6-phosphate aminotransferase (isomerizing)
MLAIELGRRRHISSYEAAKYIDELSLIPDKISQILERSDHIKEIASANIEKNNWLFLGRGFNYPVALEGALKLKEISYIHAEGLPAAEMKHGPKTIIVATEGDENIRQYADHLITVPEAPELLQPMLTVVPLQLLAYHAAVLRGHDVDKPRNLAKSVTVE